jgi:hypothetical protein
VPVAQVSPVCLSFNATPSEFKLGDDVTLYARAVNPLDGQPLAGVNVSFLQNGTSFIGPSQYVKTLEDGVASVTWHYPSDGSICTVNASVKSDNTIGNCSLAVQPVTLTVGNETRLLLEAWRDQQGTGHTVYARLLNGSGSGLQNQTVTLTVNGTAHPLQTNSTGYATLRLTLQPGDTSANTYQVMASFNGTNPRSASLNASDPYGDQYAVCTSNQYDLRPSTNCSTLAVLLQSTDAITAAKTMEDMQTKVTDRGWLGTGGEWSWFYPWFRTHVEISLGSLVIDMGFSPIFPGAGTYKFQGLEVFSDMLQEFVQEVTSDIVFLFGEYVVAKLLSIIPFTDFAAAAMLFIKWGTQVGLLMKDWNDQARMLAVSFVNILMALIACEASIAGAFINALFGILYARTLSAIYLLQSGLIVVAAPIAGVRTWLDALDVAMDMGLGVTALARYNGELGQF